jgi:thiol-disulfide isomerase/thioredoxin
MRFIRSSSLIVALLLFAGPVWSADAWIPIEKRALAPKLVLSDIKGARRQLSQFKGKVVVVNFWATWCAPCKGEMPEFTKVYAAYRDRGVEFLGAANEPRSSRPKVEAFVRDFAIQFPVWLEVSEENLAAFGVGPGIPGTVIVDKEGRIAARIAGVTEGTQLRELVDRILAEAPSSPVPAGGR